VKTIIVKVTQFWTSPSKKRRRQRNFWPSGDFPVRYFRDVHSIKSLVRSCMKHSKMNGTLY